MKPIPGYDEMNHHLLRAEQLHDQLFAQIEEEFSEYHRIAYHGPDLENPEDRPRCENAVRLLLSLLQISQKVEESQKSLNGKHGLNGRNRSQEEKG